VRYLKEAHQIGQSKQSHLLKAAYNTERCVGRALSLDAFAWSVLFWSVRCQHHALLLQLGFFFGECWFLEFAGANPAAKINTSASQPQKAAVLSEGANLNGLVLV